MIKGKNDNINIEEVNTMEENKKLRNMWLWS